MDGSDDFARAFSAIVATVAAAVLVAASLMFFGHHLVLARTDEVIQ
jgi:hypothetical protein